MTEREIQSPAQLFDLCQELFGLGGDYDTAAHPDVPFYKVRMGEIGKVKSFVRKRRLEYRSLGFAAYYCHRHNITIRSTGELIPHIGPALAEWRQAQTDVGRQVMSERIYRVREAAMGDPDQHEELLRMPDQVLAANIDAIEKRVGL